MFSRAGKSVSDEHRTYQPWRYPCPRQQHSTLKPKPLSSCSMILDLAYMYWFLGLDQWTLGARQMHVCDEIDKT